VVKVEIENSEAFGVTMNKKHIVTLTINPAIDKSRSIDRVVTEHKMRCKNPVYEPGGGGISVSPTKQALSLFAHGADYGRKCRQR
jgi:hypothetical protein